MSRAGTADDPTTGDSKTGDSKTGDSKTGDSKTGDSKTGDSPAGADSAAGSGSHGVLRRRNLVLLVAAFTSLVILTTDVYLPVLPDLRADLGTSNAAASATISAVLIGIAVGQIVIGPVSDAVGRRVPLLLGGLGYAVMHLLAALAPSIGLLLAARLFAGIATAACIVVGRAVVADIYPGAAAARGFATLSAVTAIVPIMAPVAGGALALIMGWRGMFVVLAVSSSLLTVLAWRVLPETLPVQRRIPPRLGAVLRSLWSLLRTRVFLGYVGVASAVSGMLFGYIGSSSFVLQGSFGLSPQQYGLVFALNSVGIFAASNLTRHLVGRVRARRLVGAGQAIAVLGVLVLGVGVGVHALALVMAGLFLIVCTIGLIVPTTMGLGMAAAGERAGAASGVFGICQFAVGAAASPLAGIGGSAWSLVAVTGVAALVGPVLFRTLTR